MVGNCPKYLNIKQIIPTVPNPIAHAQPLPLPEPAIALLEKADCFFITAGLSTNYRGGPHGFVRVLSNSTDSVQLAYPEYSGNRFYQTLGNLVVEPLAGIVVPDFTTGDVLYATCEARIVAGKEAASIMPRTNLVVILTLKDARFVQRSLPFRAIDGDPSPYNPPVRLLRDEGSSVVSLDKALTEAQLIDRIMLSDDIAWLKFRTDGAQKYKRGQYVALNFNTDLGIGYSHMRDDDPKSLNDDLNRSFTVTSVASTDEGSETFELVIRNVGRVTKHLIKYNLRGGVSCSVLAFDGSFTIEQIDDRQCGFLAGGVGITPLLSQIDSIEKDKLHIIWTINQKDIPFAAAAMKRWQILDSVHLYVSGIISEEGKITLSKMNANGTHIQRRRLCVEDFEGRPISKWYVCASPTLQKSAKDWLAGKEIVSESFNY